MCPSSLLLAVIATLVAVGLAHWLRRWMAFRALARALGGTGVGRGFQARLGGVQYTCRYSGGSRSEPSRLIIAIDLPSGPPFRASRSTVGSRVCLALGLGRTVGTGDPTLDQEHVVACDAGDWGTAVFGAPDARVAVVDLLGSGFTEVRAGGSRLVAAWSGFQMTEDVDASVVIATVKRLVRLRDAVVAVPAPPNAAADWRRRALATVPAVVFTVGCVLVVWVTITFAPLDRRAVFLDSLRLSLPWLALFLVVGTRAFRLNTTSPRDLAGIVLFALIGFPLTGYAAEIALNCALDAAPAAEHRAIVIERATSHSHRTTDYWAVVRSWRGARAEYIPVSSADYERLVPHRSQMAVVTRPGRLGFEWIVGKRVE